MASRFAIVGMTFIVLVVGCTTQKQPSSEKSARSTLEAYVSAWNRHDSAAFDTLLARDGTHEDLALGFKGTGPAEVKGFMRELIKLEPDFEWKLTKFTENGSNVAAEWTWTATYTGPSPNGPVTGQRISGRGASIVEVENGKIKRLTDYHDVASYFPKAAADSTKK